MFIRDFPPLFRRFPIQEYAKTFCSIEIKAVFLQIEIIIAKKNEKNYLHETDDGHAGNTLTDGM